MIIIEGEYKPVCMVECVDWVGRVDWHRCWVDGGGGTGEARGEVPTNQRYSCRTYQPGADECLGTCERELFV